MSAYLSSLVFSSIFRSTPTDDGFWDEPSTIKTPLTARSSMEDSICDGAATTGLTTRHNIAHRRKKSLGLRSAAPAA